MIFVDLTHNRTAMPFANRKKYFRGSSFQFSIVASLKLRISIKKKRILPISLKLNFTPYTLGGDGL